MLTRRSCTVSAVLVWSGLATALCACWSWSFPEELLDAGEASGGDGAVDTAQGPRDAAALGSDAQTEPSLACKQGAGCGNNGWCVSDDVCAPRDQLIYVAPPGACSIDPDAGSQNKPKCLPDALKASQKYLFLRNGEYPGPGLINVPHQLYAESKATVLKPAKCDEDFIIASEARLSGFTVAGNVLVRGAATLVGNSIGPSKCIGVLTGAGASSLVMQRNLVHGHELLGVRVEEGSFNLTNNIIVENGSDGDANNGVKASDFGGVWLKGAAQGEFSNNTVSNNLARKQSRGGAAGIYCEDPVIIRNSIVWKNLGGEGDLNPSCQRRAVLWDQDPNFVGGAGELAARYRIKSPSSAIDYPDANEAPIVDYFNQPRDVKPDLGAVEYVPPAPAK